jgi:murein DD-endopeptidase MepM/ murein hydrolase activator NlpD
MYEKVNNIFNSIKNKLSKIITKETENPELDNPDITETARASIEADFAEASSTDTVSIETDTIEKEEASGIKLAGLAFLRSFKPFETFKSLEAFESLKSLPTRLRALWARIKEQISKPPYNIIAATSAIVFVLLISNIIILNAKVNEKVNENMELSNRLEQAKDNIDKLYSANTAQREIISAKSEEIDRLKAANENYKTAVDEKINEFNRKFNEITDKYIEKSKSSVVSANVSRSGSVTRNVRTFSDDLRALRDILTSVNRMTNNTDDIAIDLSAAEAKLEAFLDKVPTHWPVTGRLGDGFGMRVHPISKKRAMHEGIDISAPSGRDIRASASGTVSFAGTKNGYGKTVIINHGSGIKTLYAHASKLLVKNGQKVKKGEVIAKVGSTGRSTGPHLHFEVQVYGTPVDPLKYLDRK